MTTEHYEATSALTRRALLRRGLALLAGASLVPLLAACASGGQAATSPSGGAGSNTVRMTDTLKYEPAEITVPKGTTVTWQNVGQVPHTVTADPAKAIDRSHVKLPEGVQPFDSGNIDAGKSWQHTFDVAGEYVYFCIPHEAGGMVGKVIVQG